MKILMIGGTGIISTAVSELLIKQGEDLYLLNRGNSRNGPVMGAHILNCDIQDEGAVKSLIRDYFFDVVVDWIVFTPDQIDRDIRLFAGKTAQYIFISSASAYQRPVKKYLITENTPLENPFWEYSRNKIACEQRLESAFKSEGFPITIIRPSLTYGRTLIPYVMTSWQKSWSLVDRIRKGKRVVVPGDGTSLWVITHNRDFAKGITGLMGNPSALGEAFHITSDEVLTWDQALLDIGAALGIEPEMVHISSEMITVLQPEQRGNLLGDKASSVVFDNSKLKKAVPGFSADISFRKGMAETYAYMCRHEELQVVDGDFEAGLDRLIEVYDSLTG